VSTHQYEVIVIGSGPAGAATAGLLARQGHDVLLLEREAFPRFHIGESLLPVSVPVLEDLGVEPDPSCFLFKKGAEFVDENSGARRTFDFEEALDGPPRYAWQVERAGFDARLRARALELGAKPLAGKVMSVEFEPERAWVRTRDAELHARYVVDATGQNRLLARKFETAEPILHFGRTAAFVHYDGLSDAAWEEIGPGHEIRVMIARQGWGWVIPLPGRRLSVGLVCREGEIAAQVCAQYVSESPLIARWTKGAVASEMRVERNFSFRNLRPCGPRYACVGDAACFLDPVFSSGVSLALVGARHLAQTLSPALAAGQESAPELMQSHHAWMDSGIDVFAAMIDRFYNTKFIENVLFGPQGWGEVARQIVSVLAGDVWRTDSGFARSLVEGRRRRSSGPREP